MEEEFKLETWFCNMADTYCIDIDDMVQFQNDVEELLEKYIQQGRTQQKIEDISEFKKMIEDKELLEKLADLEHKQWIEWAQNIINNEKISEDRLDRWAHLWVNYNQLNEEQKEKDREWARLIIEELKSQLEKEKKDE